MKKAVFLDRDGTIIRDIVYLNDPTKIEIFPEAYEALRILQENDYMILVVTNQSGVARGLVDLKNLHEINTIIANDFRARGINIIETAYCPHPVDGGCECRKPNPGMLKSLAEKFDVDLTQSWMIGDRMTDVIAGTRAGCRSILLQNELTPPIEPSYEKPELIMHDVLECAQFIIKQAPQADLAEDET